VPELLELYRKLVPTSTKEFKDKNVLVRAILLELAKDTPTGRRRRLSSTKMEPEPPNRKPLLFDPTKAEPLIPRKGTKREKLVAMLRKGATFPEVQAALGWTYKQAFCQMRRTNRDNGYGFYERAKRIYIYTYEEGPPE